MKKIISLMLCVLIISTVLLTGCQQQASVPETQTSSIEEGLKVPDVKEVDEATAKNLLSSNSLIPSVKYIYDDEIDEGLVIKTEPAIGDSIEKNSKVTVYISKGPSYILSSTGSDSTIEWYNISNDRDEWHFNSPYIKEGVLYIECQVAFACEMEWHDRQDSGQILGLASINDTFDKTVSVRAKYEKKKWKANEEQRFTLEIPLSGLNVSKPTDMYCKLSRKDGSGQKDIRVNFYITW